MDNVFSIRREGESYRVVASMKGYDIPVSEWYGTIEEVVGFAKGFNVGFELAMDVIHLILEDAKLSRPFERDCIDIPDAVQQVCNG